MAIPSPANAVMSATLRANAALPFGRSISTSTPRNEIYMVQASMSEWQLLHHLNDGVVDEAHHNLRANAQDKHQRDRHTEHRSLASSQIRKRLPFRIQRSVKNTLQHREDENRRDQQANHRDRRRTH